MAQEYTRFMPGDRVRVEATYWNAEVAGRIGTVGPSPEGVPAREGVVWVDLDVETWEPGVVDGAEVDVGALRRLSGGG